jgi:Nucleotidyl transferase AbiEii toxin, Type IV TA system
MNPGYLEFLKAAPDDRRDAFLGAARRIGTPAQNVEKDFWVCWTLDALFNGLPAGHPRLLFKGGTSLSKAYGLISRFSEDIDVTVFRGDIGQAASVEELEALSRKKRRARLDAIKDACRYYIQDTLFPQLNALAREVLSEARIDSDFPSMVIDDQDPDGQTILFWYPSVTGPPDTYIRPAVKIEFGAKSALEPHCTVAVRPDVSREVSGISLEVANVTAVVAERTFWDKVVILHGLRRWHENRGVLRSQGQRVSRHYYDVHRMMRSEAVAGAINDHVLASDCVRHARMFFSSPDLGLDTAAPGTFVLGPTGDMLADLRRDYERMAGMIIGEVPMFDEVIESVRELETRVNGARDGID